MSKNKIPNLIHELEEAESELKNMQCQLDDARRKETGAINRLNNAQKILDTALEDMKKKSATCSGWGREYKK